MTGVMIIPKVRARPRRTGSEIFIFFKPKI
jgi:hypothetical protein